MRHSRRVSGDGVVEIKKDLPPRLIRFALLIGFGTPPGQEGSFV
jgi:hypothetical protein